MGDTVPHTPAISRKPESVSDSIILTPLLPVVPDELDPWKDEQAARVGHKNVIALSSSTIRSKSYVQGPSDRGDAVS
jgi:hypothetical protein